MAKITCTEHRETALDAEGRLTLVFGKPLATQTLAAPGAASLQTAAFGLDTALVRLCSDVPLHVSFAAAATVADDYWPAGSEIVYRVSPGIQLSYLAG